MTPIKDVNAYLKGKRRLPPGVVPMAFGGVGLVCLMVDGRWCTLMPSGAIIEIKKNLGPQVLKTIIEHLGLSSAKLAELVSSDDKRLKGRTIEAWRSGQAIPPYWALRIIKIQGRLNK